MKFNDHRKLEGCHSFLSPSNYHWVGYSKEKLRQVYLNQLAKERGTRLHAFARDSILLGQKLSNSKKALNRFVNDAIGYRMTPEQVLYYSPNCFGTCDAISYKDGLLRIFDLKTGETKASFAQLHIYAAIFFLEYENISLADTTVNLRIYQGMDIREEVMETDEDKYDVAYAMSLIRVFDEEIEKLKQTL